MTLCIETWGQGSPLVFLHGWGFDSSIWHALIPFLQHRFQLILVDLPGSGYSEVMSWEAFKEAVKQQLPPEFFLIGWSLGGLYATRLALEEPQRVQGLMNIASTPCFIKDSRWPGLAAATLTQFHHNLKADLNKTLQDFMQLQLGNSTERMTFIPKKEYTHARLQFGLNILQTWDLRDNLNQLSVPTRFIFGKLDRIVPVETVKMMTVHFPNLSCSLYEKAAHMPFLSHTERFISELYEFIQ